MLTSASVVHEYVCFFRVSYDAPPVKATRKPASRYYLRCKVESSHGKSNVYGHNVLTCSPLEEGAGRKLMLAAVGSSEGMTKPNDTTNVLQSHQGGGRL